jgi:hypothetical protein
MKNIIYKIFGIKKVGKDFNNNLKVFLKKYQPKSQGNILVWEMGGFERILAKNAIIATALKLRGYKPIFLICSGTPKACIQRGMDQNEKIEDWSKRCSSCQKSMISTANMYMIDYILTDEIISKQELDKFEKIANEIDVSLIKDYFYEGINVGEITLNSFYRFMKGSITEFKKVKEEDLKIYRLYFFASLVNVELSKNMIKKINPLAFLSSHGIYTDYQPATAFSVIKKIPSTTWISGYNKLNHYFNAQLNPLSMQLTGVKNILWNMSISTKISSIHLRKINNFFKMKYKKNQSVEFLENKFNKIANIKKLKKTLNLTNDKVVCLFCHVNWDAGIDNSQMLFSNTNQWVIESIKVMIEVKDVDWIIKIHPSEKFNECIKGTLDVIKENFDLENLPKNIKIIDDKNKINAYGLFNLIDCGITICGTAGIELPFLGKPVLLAGKAHYSNKGFTIDPSNKEEYLNYLRDIKKLKKLNKDQMQLATKFAYLYFIKRQTYLSIINEKQGHWGDLDLKKLKKLLPKKNKIIDNLCNSIINGNDFLTD